MRVMQKRSCGEYIKARSSARLLCSLACHSSLKLCNPTNTSVIPQSTVIVAVIASGSHVVYLIFCLHPMKKRSLGRHLADATAYDIVQSLTYATLKFFSDSLALGISCSSTWTEWLRVLLATSIAAALVAEVIPLHLPISF
jgi:hypothetical protein